MQIDGPALSDVLSRIADVLSAADLGRVEALRRPQAASHVGVSPVTFDVMVRDGRMPQPRCIGTRRVWLRTELYAALVRLPRPDGSVPAPADDGEGWDIEG